MTDFNAAEKRAAAARDNAFVEVSKVLVESLKTPLGVLPATVLGFAQEGQPPVPLQLYLPLAPHAMMETINQMQQRLTQLDIAVGALIELLLEERFVVGIPDPQATADQKAPPLLSESKLTREEYFNRCAKHATTAASAMRRMLLSRHPAGDVPRILRPS